MDENNFIDDATDDFYIDNMDEVDGAAHRDGPNTLIDEAYGEMMAEKRPDQDDIYDATCDKSIGTEVIMYVPVEGPRRTTVRLPFEDLDGENWGCIIGTHSWILESTVSHMMTGPMIATSLMFFLRTYINR